MPENVVKRNCKNCEDLCYDTYEDSWNGYNYCGKGDSRDNLKSFPFEKEQSCHTPGLAQYIDEDTELKTMMQDTDIEDIWHLPDHPIQKRFREKYNIQK